MELNISRNDMILAFSDALDLLDKKLYHHHKTVAFVAINIASYLSINDEDVNDLILASLLHDIGMFKYEEGQHISNFTEDNPNVHSRIGYLLINQYPTFEKIARIVLHHHTPYNNKLNAGTTLSHLLHLADMVSTELHFNEPVILQRNAIVTKVMAERGTRFMPIVCDAFKNLSQIESFWMSMESGSMHSAIRKALRFDSRITTIEELFHIGSLFITAIDYRSRYTAAHSVGVSKVARCLGSLANIPLQDQAILEVAGYFHDIGKVAISKDILDKPGHLTPDEYLLIKGHTFYTYEILKNVDGFGEIAQIAAFHHERLDGSGYPFHLRAHALSQYSRLMAVADLFTALTEMRPYRNNLTKKQIIDILLDFVVRGQLDNQYVDLAIRHFNVLYEENASYQKLAYNDFDLFEEKLQINHYLNASIALVKA